MLDPKIMEQLRMQYANMQQQQPPPPTQWAGGSNSYLENESAANLANKGRWEDFVRQLGVTNLANITDFNSPLYQQYQSYLQKATPGIGVNTLLAPLLAGGASYGGSQKIASERMKAMQGQRSDAINQNVQGFALGLQNQVNPLLSQIGGSFFQSRQLDQQDAARRDANNPWASIGSLIGGIGGNLLAPGIGGMLGSQLGGMAGGVGGGVSGNAMRPFPSPYGG